MKPEYATVEAKVTAIEAEMKRSGLWQSDPLAPEQYAFQQAFAMDTMAFSQWLQFIFIPRVRGIIQTRGEFPSSSSVGAQAIREFDGFEEAAELVSILSGFDSLLRPGK